MLQLYWGDLHCHTAASYGHGPPDWALARAAAQLDFCSTTGHAFWPDMPSDRSLYADIIDYHNDGFQRLAGQWDKLLELQAAANRPGRFVVLPSYEWHSLKYGDHNVYTPGPDLPLVGADDLPALRAVAARAEALVIPHHIGYAAGYRGIDWRHFREERSPFVEIYSMHGCAISEYAPYPMLHDMGPRDFGSTAEAGWALGHRFGIVGSTDHHSAYPGSHGDGRMGVFAQRLTRRSLWEAFLARRVFAATGDKIDARLFVDDAWIGSTVTAPGRRRLRVSVRGIDALDKVEVLKNGRVIRRLFPEQEEPDEENRAYRLRVTWGWGRKQEMASWDGRLTLSQGEIRRVDTCFSGPAVVAPKTSDVGVPLPEDEKLPHELLEQTDHCCRWRSRTVGNLSTRHATTQALSIELNGPLSATIVVEVNGQKYESRLEELLRAGRSHYLRGWLTEAIRIGPLTPLSDCTVEAEFTDEPERDVDLYRLQAAQSNGHWAWLSPIWAER